MTPVGAWLALDTATDVASVAVGVPGRPAHGAVEVGPRRQAARVVVMVDEVMHTARLRLSDLAGVVVADGPGSFTGLRIGWAAAKGLVHDRGLALWCAPSLQAHAFAAWRSAGAAAGVAVAACFDALRGQVFAAIYAFTPSRVHTVVAPSLTTLAELARVAPSRPAVVTGDGARRYADEIFVWTGRGPTDSGPAVGDASAAALLALHGWEDGPAPVPDPAVAEPVYGRPAEAQARWEARHGRPLPDPSRGSR